MFLGTKVKSVRFFNLSVKYLYEFFPLLVQTLDLNDYLSL